MPDPAKVAVGRGGTGIRRDVVGAFVAPGADCGSADTDDEWKRNGDRVSEVVSGADDDTPEPEGTDRAGACLDELAVTVATPTPTAAASRTAAATVAGLR